MDHTSQPLPFLTVIACSSQKRAEPAEARDLYRSDLFQKARAYVEAAGRQWVIFSALLGPVAPSDVVVPYDVTLADLDDSERRLKAKQVASYVFRHALATGWTPHKGPGPVVELLCGRLYREHLQAELESRGLRVVVPMARLGIGQQKAWLKREADRLAVAVDAAAQLPGEVDQVLCRCGAELPPDAPRCDSCAADLEPDPAEECADASAWAKASTPALEPVACFLHGDRWLFAAYDGSGTHRSEDGATMVEALAAALRVWPSHPIRRRVDLDVGAGIVNPWPTRGELQYGGGTLLARGGELPKVTTSIDDRGRLFTVELSHPVGEQVQVRIMETHHGQLRDVATYNAGDLLNLTAPLQLGNSTVIGEKAAAMLSRLAAAAIACRSVL